MARRRGPGETEQLAAESQVLATGEVAVDVGIFGHEPDAALRFPGGVRVSADRDGPRIGVDDLGDRLDGGGLAGAVGPQETEDLSPQDFEAQTLEDLDVGLEEARVKGLAKVVDAELDVGHVVVPPVINAKYNEGDRHPTPRLPTACGRTDEPYS